MMKPRMDPGQKKQVEGRKQGGLAQASSRKGCMRGKGGPENVLCTFNTSHEAGLAYDAAVRKLYGADAKLNLPELYGHHFPKSNTNCWTPYQFFPSLEVKIAGSSSPVTQGLMISSGSSVSCIGGGGHVVGEGGIGFPKESSNSSGNGNAESYPEKEMRLPGLWENPNPNPSLPDLEDTLWAETAMTLGLPPSVNSTSKGKQGVITGDGNSWDFPRTCKEQN